MPFRKANVPMTIAGFLALAVAMGIGRFAFTPILPMMQTDFGLSLAQGGWLASSNYLGYLLGALIAAHVSWSAATLLRIGLWLVVISTAIMGIDTHWAGWLIWRLAAGIASAFVLIGTSALCISKLNAAGKSQQSGLIFSGVGSGIAFAGFVCMGLYILDTSSAQAWLSLAIVAYVGLIFAASLWHTKNQTEPTGSNPTSTEQPAASRPNTKQNSKTPLHWGLILCYGFFGFGYILPATFIPAQAKTLVSDPLLFSLAWPIFGIACALSTIIASRLSGYYSRRQIWAAAHIIMATGVLAPVVWESLVSIIIAAICVGSTIMVITMVGLQEGQATIGNAGAKRQIAAMTASFALGQFIGPIFFSMTHEWFGAPMELSLILGAIFLLASVIPILKMKTTAL